MPISIQYIGEYARYEDHHIGEGRGVTEVGIEHEGLPENVEGGGHRRVGRPALPGEHVGFVEELHRSARRCDDGEEDDGHQKGQRYLEELPPPAGAVHLGGLVDFGVDVLQAHEKEDHVVAGPAPRKGQHNGHPGPKRIVEPPDRLAYEV